MKDSAFHFMAQHTGALILAQARDNSVTPQAGWRRMAQGQLLDWLSAGGFHAEPQVNDVEAKTENTNENSGNNAAVLTSRSGTQCEELKFTRVRISDAVR